MWKFLKAFASEIYGLFRKKKTETISIRSVQSPIRERTDPKLKQMKDCSEDSRISRLHKSSHKGKVYRVYELPFEHFVAVSDDDAVFKSKEANILAVCRKYPLLKKTPLYNHFSNPENDRIYRKLNLIVKECDD